LVAKALGRASLRRTAAFVAKRSSGVGTGQRVLRRMSAREPCRADATKAVAGPDERQCALRKITRPHGAGISYGAKEAPAAHLIYEALIARLFRELGATLTHRTGRDSGLTVRGVTSISSIATDRSLSDAPVTTAMWSRQRLSLSANRAMRHCRSAGSVLS
jgi:hypothetical protein